ncbi:MAG: hypothetical protein K6G10_01220 [Butyrivibrio sp.]|nr:hypothetical protein [Butyrivibrio sp.]
MPITFDFRLADVASQSEVINSANGTTFTNSITCPATLTYTGTSASNRTTDGSTLTISNSRITGNNNTAFSLQRAYGRNFDTNAALTGEVTWSSSYVAGSETDHSSPVSSNTYETSRNMSSASPEAFYYYDEDTDTYWKYDETKTTTVVGYQTDEVYRWTKDYDVTYDGSLGSVNMKDDVDRVTVGYTRNKSDVFTKTNVEYSYDNAEQITDPDELQTLIDAGTDFKRSFKENPATVESAKTKTYDNTSLNSGTHSDVHYFYKDGDNGSLSYAFSFSHRISHDLIVNGSGGKTNLNLAFSEPAKRVFRPQSHSASVSEHDFNNIQVNAPEKQLIIQASPDSEILEQIEIKWSALNLNAIGMAGTNTLSASAAKAAIDEAKTGIKKISEERGKFGAMQNRCEHAYKEVGIARENTQHSESVIRDTDMAAEMVRLSNHNVLEQAGQAMLSQANQSKDGVLNLLQ